jgi:hypothetical protein
LGCLDCRLLCLISRNINVIMFVIEVVNLRRKDRVKVIVKSFPTFKESQVLLCNEVIHILFVAKSNLWSYAAWV